MSKTAFVFPGQGSQFPGMGGELYSRGGQARELFEEANEIMGFRISDIMFEGSEEELRRTDVTQPAIFIHSVIAYKMLSKEIPDMVAGHSLGEFSALVASGSLAFADGLRLVKMRADAMQKACALEAGTMAAILGLADELVEKICLDANSTIVPANYNCPGQLVISGAEADMDAVCEAMKAAGAKRALKLTVGGAFHSPLMKPAEEELKQAIEEIEFKKPVCPIHQNVVAWGVIHIDDIKTNLYNQLTRPVRWTQCVQSMWAMNASRFVECGPGKVLQGLVQKINRNAVVEGLA